MHLIRVPPCVDNSSLTPAIRGLVVSSGSVQQSALNSARTVLPLPSVSTPQIASLRAVEEITGTDHLVHAADRLPLVLDSEPMGIGGKVRKQR